MAHVHRIRLAQAIREAEGYLELGMPRQALSSLDRAHDGGPAKSKVLYLRGEALCSLNEFAAALEPLQQAADKAPSNPRVWLALGGCHQRNGQLQMAIEVLSQAAEIAEGEAEVHYKLACYWSLAHNKPQALASLARAIKLDVEYRKAAESESDFAPLRDDQEFQRLTAAQG